MKNVCSKPLSVPCSDVMNLVVGVFGGLWLGHSSLIFLY